jgi:hypothetical protein
MFVTALDELGNGSEIENARADPGMRGCVRVRCPTQTKRVRVALRRLARPGSDPSLYMRDLRLVTLSPMRPD